MRRENTSDAMVLSRIVFGALLSIIFCQGISHAVTVQEYVDHLVGQAESFSRQAGKQTLAVAYMNKAIQLQPNRAGLYYKRARIFGRAGMYVNAIKDLNRLVNNKSYPHAIRFRGDCYLALGLFQRAVKDYTAFLRFDPKDGKVWTYLTEALALMGRRDLALEAVRKGLATQSHWAKRLNELQRQIVMGERITPHSPFSN